MPIARFDLKRALLQNHEDSTASLGPRMLIDQSSMGQSTNPDQASHIPERVLPELEIGLVSGEQVLGETRIGAGDYQELDWQSAEHEYLRDAPNEAELDLNEAAILVFD